MTDPFQVLGVSRDASDSEIKKAYRTLSRKYHPDANINNPHKEEAEEKFKELQQAYQQIINEREHGGAQSGGSRGYSGYGGYGGFQGFDGGFRAEGQSEEYVMHLKSAAIYIQNHYYNDAINVLNQMQERTGQWYYLSAVANMGLGNNLMALEYARQAVMQEPYNQQYQQLVRMLESGGTWYQGMQRDYQPSFGCSSDLCLYLCIGDMFCNLCFGGGYYC